MRMNPQLSFADRPFHRSDSTRQWCLSITRFAACQPGTRYPCGLTKFLLLLLLLLEFQRSDRVGVGRRASISLRVKD